jgi:hypothetical protein
MTKIKEVNTSQSILPSNEFMCLRFHVFGFKDKYIGDILNMSEAKVKDLRHFLFKRLNALYEVNSNSESIKIAFETGLLDKYDFLGDDKKIQLDILTREIYKMKLSKIMNAKDNYYRHKKVKLKILSILEKPPIKGN